MAADKQKNKENRHLSHENMPDDRHRTCYNDDRQAIVMLILRLASKKICKWPLTNKKQGKPPFKPRKTCPMTDTEHVIMMIDKQ